MSSKCLALVCFFKVIIILMIVVASVFLWVLVVFAAYNIVGSAEYKEKKGKIIIHYSLSIMYIIF